MKEKNLMNFHNYNKKIDNMVWEVKKKIAKVLVQAKFLMPPANINFLCYSFSCLSCHTPEIINRIMGD
jgi:hypothetical protein